MYPNCARRPTLIRLGAAGRKEPPHADHPARQINPLQAALALQRIEPRPTYTAPSGILQPLKWGNPFRLGETQIRIPALDGSEWEHEGRLHKTSGEKNFYCTGTDPHGTPVGVWHQIEDATLDQCIDLFRDYITKWARVDPSDLAGKDLACWCPLEDADGNRVPCHADVLLELANQGEER